MAQPGDPAQWTQDLGLDSVVKAFGAAQRHTPFIRQTLAALNTDPAVIAWRQAILRDFLANSLLLERLNGLLSRLADLRIGHPQLGKYQRNVLLDTADRLAELGLYVDAVQELYDAFRDIALQSEGLLTLRQNLQALVEDEQFQTLKSKLPELRRPLDTFASLTVGINLDSQLRPASAVLLAVNEQRFGGIRSFLGKLFAVDKPVDEALGVSPLHQVPSDPEIRPLSPLFRDLDHLIAQSVQPVTRALSQFAQVNIGPVAALENEIAFYVASARLIARMESQGIQFCQPESAPMADRLTHVEGLINVHLALRDNTVKLVGNDVILDNQGRIAILTGPNSGGKTTYVQAVGLAQVFFQAGLLVPARSARMSPADSILTHFPALESFQGR
ncbi:MAG TPA: hypothetical protein VKQ72_17065, partial [Aggregatilineales bacterium]|nr:hypothetical protein [Aggregatilineales bacterium]